MIHGSRALHAHSGRAMTSLSAGLIGLLPFMLFILIMGGCEDAASAQRGEVQQQIDRAARELSLVRLSGSLQAEARDDGRPQSRDAARATLEDIARRTSTINRGSSGQQEAAAMLAATAHFELGTLLGEDLSALEATLMTQRGSLHQIADRALILQGLVDGLKASAYDAHRGLLTISREEAETQRRQTEAEQRRLQTPIDERQTAIDRDRTESLRFIEEAGDLRREALLVGAYEGLPTWTEAIELERRAGRIDRAIADREVELEYEYRPELEFASNMAAARREQIRSIDEAMDAFGDAGRSRQTVIAETEDVIRAFSQRMDQMLQEVAAAGATADEALTNIASQFERAASQAQRATRGSGRDAAAGRMIALRAHKSLAAQYAIRSAAAESRAALLQRIANAGDTLGNPGRAAEGVREATRQAQELKDKAREHLEQAREAAGQIPAGSDIDSIARSLDRAIAMLDGRRPTDDSAARRSGTPPGAGGQTSRAARGGAAAAAGADSPQTLIAAMNRANDDPTGKAFLALLHGEGPVGQRMVDLQVRMVGAIDTLMQAMSEQFGEGAGDSLTDSLGAASMAAGAIEDLAIIDQSDDRARVTGSHPLQGPLEFDIVRTPQGWKIDFMSMLGPFAQDPQMLGMMEQSIRRMIPAFEGLAGRVRSGEISSPDEIEAAMMAAMMQGG